MRISVCSVQVNLAGKRLKIIKHKTVNNLTDAGSEKTVMTTFDNGKIITCSSSTFYALGIHFIKGQLRTHCPYSIIEIHGWHEASCCADMILVAVFERMYA